MKNSPYRFQATDTVGAIVARQPSLSRVFEHADIDYCCGGKIPLEEACRKKGLDLQQFLVSLEAAAASADQGGIKPAEMTLTALADHIETTHHAYLKTELPRLEAMTKKVAAVHGEHDPRLRQVSQVYQGMAEELAHHTMKEEQILFPMIRKLEAGSAAHGSLADPIHAMETEHDDAGAALLKVRELTDGFTPPDWACNTYRAMLDALTRFENDLHQHVHKENSVLFPRALAFEKQKAA
ncbi:MAG: iron-sulfur cluster repair di-iron protein [Verrucomicrobiae bacterium]|nr:iron-sulfur cluster repair di-iron protein [Verrucomicrobiae bacterium]